MNNFDLKKYLAEGILLKEGNFLIGLEDDIKAFVKSIKDDNYQRSKDNDPDYEEVKPTLDFFRSTYPEYNEVPDEMIEPFLKTSNIEGGIDESIQEGQGDDLLTLVQDYISNDFTLDQGYGDAVGKAEEEQPMLRDKIVQLKGEDYFSKVEKVANLLTYEAEYVTADESEELEQKIQDVAEELGFTKDELSGM